MILRADRFPVPHAFSTREGGVSEGPYASLNLGFSVNDEPRRVEENLRRFAAAVEIPLQELHSVSQVHGATILEASGPAPEGTLPPVTGEADALFTARAGAAVGVKTADCVPVLLADPGTRTVAAVHSGWKGTELEIATRTIERLVARGAKLSEVAVAIGPCIRACCYEVSPELAERFRARFGAEVIRASGGKGPHLDLVAAIVGSLERAGVRARQIEVLERCTACEPALFFSHRRDRGVSGRHFSVAHCRF